MGTKTMKNKHRGIILCGLMLTILLSTTALAAAAISRNTEPETSGLLGKTSIRGFALYLGKDSTGRTTRLFALRIRYISISLTGERDNGVLLMRKIEIPTRITGYHGHLYIAASFRGSLNI